MIRFRRLVLIVGLCLLLWTRGEGRETAVSWADPPALSEGSYEVLQTYLSVEQALKLQFPTSDRVVTESVRLTDAQAGRVAKLADHPLWEHAFIVYKGMTGEHVDGYAVATDETGKFHHITFMVGVTPDGRVKRTDVLVYRESRGSEIRQRRFLQQYAGKSLRDPIRANRDILNVTGATLSVHAVNRGVRKVLGVIREAYGIG